jgi:hypothetical protein
VNSQCLRSFAAASNFSRQGRAQADHGFVNSFQKVPADLKAAYSSVPETCKIVLSVPDLPALMHVWAQLPATWYRVREGLGAPEGLSTITALGIRPALRQVIHPFTKRLKPM